MLIVSDTLLADIAYLSSDKLIDPPEPSLNSESFNLAYMTGLVEDYQPYIQRNFRREDIEWMIRISGIAEGDNQISKVLSKLANRFLIWQGNRFEVKPEKLDEWLESLSLIDGSWVIAQAYADLLTKISFDDVLACISNHQCPHALISEPLKGSYADNHVHLGGHGHFGPSLLSFALYGEYIKAKNWPKRPEYTQFESHKYSKNDLPKWCNSLSNTLVNSEFEHESSTIYSQQDFPPKDYSDSTFYLRTRSPSTTSQKCFWLAYQNTTRADIQWLVFCLGVLKSETKVAKSILPRLVRVSNIMRNYIVVWGTGLGQFVESFRFNARKSRANGFQDHFSADGLTSDIDDNIMREFRTSPNVLINDNRLTPKNLKNYLNQALNRYLSKNIHFVIHFTRGFNRHDKLGLRDKIQSNTRMLIKNQVQVLQTFYASSSCSSITIEEHQTTNLTTESKTIDLRKAVRGFDVAGNENELPIEVFAPALRVLRQAEYSTLSAFSQRIQKPFLTVHSGEDYSHLLSGLRAVDEAVYFCDFQPNDRLGHALALGVVPIDWANKQQTAYLSLGEHLDNLVWCYQQAIEVSQFNSEFIGVIQLLSDKVEFWSSCLYGEAYSAKELYQAWRLRKNCPLTYDSVYNANSEQNEFNDPLINGWLKDFGNSSETFISPKVEQLWRDYNNAHIKKDRYYELRAQAVQIHCKPKSGQTPMSNVHGVFVDTISAPELQLYEAIQDLLIEKYTNKGIVIEACPTSNIYIGRFEHYHEHPIFRWTPPEPSWLSPGGKFNKFGLRKGNANVCINTDDSAIMPTTIQNEHRVIRNAVVNYFDLNANTADEWIKKIQQMVLHFHLTKCLLCK